MKTYSFDGKFPESNVKASTFSVFFVVLSTCILALAIYINSLVPEPLGIQDEKLSMRKSVIVCNEVYFNSTD